MRKLVTLLCALALAGGSQAAEVGGVKLPDTRVGRRLRTSC